MTLIEMQEIIYRCKYKPGWNIVMCIDPGTELRDTRPFIQLHVTNGIDTVTGQPCAWRSGKRYLSLHMCRQELVGAVFGMIKDAETHEIHEWFRYRGATIFNQHLDPDVLAEVARKKASFCLRENAMSMDEVA